MYISRAPKRIVARGFGGVRGFGLTCPPGQNATNMYDGTVKCCGGPTPASDPCSYINTNQGYLDTQRQAQADAIAGAAGGNTQLLKDLSMYPQNVQQAALNCYTNPGQTITDILGRPVVCPSPSNNERGIFVSAYTPQQLAAMINGGAAPDVQTPINTVGTPIQAPNADPILTTGGSGSFPLSVRLVNSSGGSNSIFNVGDSWTVIVTGPPNSQVSATASRNGSSVGTGSQGVINSSGQLTLTGVMTATQVGTWTESWTVGGKPAGQISFSVVAPGSSASGDTSGTSSTLPSTVSVGGFSIPTWGLIAAGIGAVFLFGGKR
jgi:hypothetical protein